MMDIFSREKRSEIMLSIRSTGTVPEATVYRILRELLGNLMIIERNDKSLPGSPDFYIPSVRVALFVHGCFWHCCPKHGSLPRTNTDYWIPKLAANLRRDKRAQGRLNKLGISVWRTWEHDLKNRTIGATASRLANRFSRIGLPVIGFSIK